MAADKIDIAKALFGKDNNPDATSTFSGIAWSDSEDGLVSIKIDGGGVLEVPTTVAVSQGDTVLITKTNNIITVTGSVGKGDAQQAAIYKAISEAGGGGDEHFYSDTNGAHITNNPTNPTENMVTIDSSGVSIIKDGLAVANFEDDKIQLGIGYPSAKIEIGDNAGYLVATGDDKKGFAIGGYSDGPLQILSPNTSDDFTLGYGSIAMLTDGGMSMTTHRKSSSGTYQGGGGIQIDYDSSTGTSNTTLALAADVIKFVTDGNSSISDCAVIGRGIVRQVFIVSGNVSLAAVGATDTSKSYYPVACLSKPLCIPYSSGYWTTKAPTYVGKTYLKGVGYNHSDGAHSGILQYVCIEFYGMDSPYN